GHVLRVGEHRRPAPAVRRRRGLLPARPRAQGHDRSGPLLRRQPAQGARGRVAAPLLGALLLRSAGGERPHRARAPGSDARQLTRSRTGRVVVGWNARYIVRIMAEPGIEEKRKSAPANAGAAPRTATLQFDGKSYTLPVVEGSEGERAVDITRLRQDSGLITPDSGYGNTGACRSSICFIGGEEGILRYRGYPIEELAEKSSFLEVAWLLLYGELPTRERLTGYTREITRHTMLHEDFRRFFDFMPKSAHPMPVAAAAV